MFDSHLYRCITLDELHKLSLPHFSIHKGGIIVVATIEGFMRIK